MKLTALNTQLASFFFLVIYMPIVTPITVINKIATNDNMMCSSNNIKKKSYLSIYKLITP